MHSITNVAVQLGYFFLLLTVGFCIIWLVFWPAVYFVFTRENPFLLYKQVVPAILVAIGSVSSAITLPISMQCMQNNDKLSKPIAQTVLPLGMTIHMNGVSLYYPMCALFVAQVKGVEVDTAVLFVLG